MGIVAENGSDISRILAMKETQDADGGIIPPTGPSGDSVHVYNPYGEPETIDKADLTQALAGGYRVAPAADVAAASAEKQAASEYGTGPLSAIEAFGAGALRGATASLSDPFLVRTGLAKKDTLEKLQKYRPGYSIAGEVTGIAAPALLTGGTATAAAQTAGRSAAEYIPSVAIGKLGAAIAKAATPADIAAKSLANKILSKAAATGLGSAVEGAAFGLGQTVSEAALGNPDLNAEKIIGGAEIAGGIGFLLGGVGGALSHFTGIKNLPARIEPALPAGSVESPLTGVPKSIEEMGERIKSAAFQNMSTELPAKAELTEAAGRLPDLQYGPHDIQVESLTHQQARDLYKTGLEMQTKEAEILRNWEAVQKAELTNKTASTIESIAPETKLTADPVEAGNKLVTALKKATKAEDEAVAPIFEKFKEMAVVPADPWELIGKIEGGIPGASKFVDISEEGQFTLAKYQDKMPFSKAIYGDIKKIVNAANDNTLTLADLRNVRNNLGSHIKFDSPPLDKRFASGLKKNLMDYMQDTVQRVEPDLQLREAFKRYAINQEKRATLEYIMGGSLRENVPLSKTIVPEDVLKNIFSDSSTVDAAKGLMGKEEFNKTAANFLQSKIVEFTDKGAFSSNKFGSFLKKKGPELEAAFQDNPGILQRLKDLNTISRILPDSAPINNSQTAKTLTLMGLLKQTGSILKHPTSAIAEGLEHIGGAAERRKVYAELNEILAGKSKEDLAALSKITDLHGGVQKTAQNAMDHASVLSKIERALQSMSRTISQGAAAIFRVPTDKDMERAKAKRSKGWGYKEVSGPLQDYASNPEKMIDMLHHQTGVLHAVAPNIVSGLQMTAIKSTQFLASKLPQQPAPRPLAPAYRPSVSEVTHFNKYYDIAKNPMDLLHQLQTGTVTPEAIEAIQTIYPLLYTEMQTQVMDQLTKHIADKNPISYKIKTGLSLFLGQPLDYSSDPLTVAANQTALAGAVKPGEVAQTGSPSASRADKITVASRAMTPFQSIESEA